MSITIANLRTKVLQLIGESSGTPHSSTEVDRVINMAQEDIALWLIKVDPALITKSTTISRVSGTLTYALPADFLAVRRVTNSHKVTLFPIPQIDREFKSGWYLDGAYIALCPSTITETVTFEYNYLPADLTDAVGEGTENISVLPDMCDDLIAYQAGVILKRNTEEFESMNELEKALARKIELVMRIMANRSNMENARIRNTKRGGNVRLT